ncbi:MAG: hypothetical protein VX899_27530 [Myxococcota bacterium]|nr:hypothetical protein [Myxococcota bacterium]
MLSLLALSLLPSLFQAGGPQPVAEVNLSDAPSNPWVADYSGPIAIDNTKLFTNCPAGELTTPVILTLDEPAEKLRIKMTQPGIKVKGGTSKGMMVVQRPDNAVYCADVGNESEVVVSGPAGEWLIFVGHVNQPNMGLERPFTLTITNPKADLSAELDGSEAEHRALGANQGLLITGRTDSQRMDQSKLSHLRYQDMVCLGQLSATPVTYLDVAEAQQVRVRSDADRVALVGPLERPWQQTEAVCINNQQEKELAAGTWALYPVNHGRNEMLTLSVEAGEVQWDAWAQAWDPPAESSVDDRELARVFPKEDLKEGTKSLAGTFEAARRAPAGAWVFVAQPDQLSPAGSGSELPAAGEAMLVLYGSLAISLDGRRYAVKPGALTTERPSQWVAPQVRNLPDSLETLVSLGMSSPQVDVYRKAEGDLSRCRTNATVRYDSATKNKILTPEQSAAASKRLEADNAKCAPFVKTSEAAEAKAVAEMQAQYKTQVQAEIDATAPQVQALLGL